MSSFVTTSLTYFPSLLLRIYGFPAYSRGVKTNLGKLFLTLVRKHFPPGSPLYVVCNKNTIKLSYSCTKNMKVIIQAHNRRILNKCNVSQPTPPCNCRIKSSCPVQGKCQVSGIYRAIILPHTSDVQTVSRNGTMRTKVASGTKIT